MSSNNELRHELSAVLNAYNDMLDLVKAHRDEIAGQWESRTPEERRAMCAMADVIAASVSGKKMALKASLDKLLP